MKQLLLLNFFLLFVHYTIFAQIWQNDFSNSGEWLSTDLNGGSDTWIISSTAIGGSVDTINSATAGNGFAQFNSNGQCAATHQDVTLTYFQQIDISANELSYLEFVQHYQRKSDSVYVEFSNDGLTWESIRINQEYWYYQQTENPDTVQVSIPSTVHNASFWLRFRFSGECGFAWLIDDLKIFEKEQYAANIQSEIQIGGFRYFEINQCISDTLDLFMEIENFGYDTLFNVVVQTTLYRDGILDAIRYDTLPQINPETTIDTLFSDMVVDPFYVEILELTDSVYSNNLDTIIQSNSLDVTMEHTRQHDNQIHGYYHCELDEMAIGNIYVFAEEYCPSYTRIFIADAPELIGQYVYLEYWKLVNNVSVFVGYSDDYQIPVSELGTWINMLSFLNQPYYPNDTAMVFYGTYGASYPLPYAGSSKNSAVVMRDWAGNVSVQNGPSLLIDLTPYSASNCYLCFNSIKENSAPYLSIFPNPSSDKIQLQNLTQPIETLLIYSMDGRQVHTESQPNSESISISNLQSGTYLVVVELQDGSTLQAKFVKN